MKNSYYILLLSLLLAATPQTTSAYWPTTLEENLAIYADPDTSAIDCMALPFSQGRTLVVFFLQGTGYCYQIIDRYGNFEYDSSQPLVPGALTYSQDNGLLISDGEGGAFVAWRSYVNPLGIFAQRLDSLGNLQWGDEGVMIFPVEEPGFDISVDGEGGLFMGVIPDWTGSLFVQKVESDGSLPWGSMGALANVTPHYASEGSKVCHNGNGGAYVIWRDHRPPFSYSADFVQQIDNEGNPLWSNDLFIESNRFFHQILPDEEGGCLIHTGPGGGFNTVRRIDTDGHFMWVIDHVSWNSVTGFVPGEPGIFYLGFNYGNAIYGQRMDTNGNSYWPSWPDNYGALMFSFPNWVVDHESWSFVYPYFNEIFSGDIPNVMKFISVQSLDTVGNQVFRESSVFITTETEMVLVYLNLNAHHTEDGVTAIWERNYYDINHKIYAKHVTPYGTLGGPFPIISTLTPSGIPIQIPPTGGSFTFDVALTDSDSVGGLFDAWIDVVLQTGSSLDLILRSQLELPPDGELIRNDITQYVPAGAPAGTYMYSLKVGYYPNSLWSSDSFEFEKLSTGSLRGVIHHPEAIFATNRDSNPPLPPLSKGGNTTSPLYQGGTHEVQGGSTQASTRARHASPLHGDTWLLTGFFGKLAGKINDPTASGGAPQSPVPKSQSLALVISPNPFNPTTVISIQLSSDSHVNLEIYDVSGRKVATLVDGRRQAGYQQLTFDGSDLASGIYFVKFEAGKMIQIRKMVLIK